MKKARIPVFDKLHTGTSWNWERKHKNSLLSPLLLKSSLFLKIRGITAMQFWCWRLLRRRGMSPCAKDTLERVTAKSTTIISVSDWVFFLLYIFLPKVHIFAKHATYMSRSETRNLPKIMKKTFHSVGWGQGFFLVSKMHQALQQQHITACGKQQVYTVQRNLL